MAEQNLYAQAASLIGDRNARAHEYTLQLRPFDADTSGTHLGVPVLAAFVGALLDRAPAAARSSPVPSTSVAPWTSWQTQSRSPNSPSTRAPPSFSLPVTARRELINLPDDVWTKLNIEFYSDAADGVFKLLE